MPPVRLERDGDVAELVLDAPPLNLFGEEVLVGPGGRRRGVPRDAPAHLTTRLLALTHRVWIGGKGGRDHTAHGWHTADRRGADDRTAESTSHLFETADSRRAVESFLQDGPGKADFTGE